VYCHPHYDLLMSHDPYCGDLDSVFRGGSSPADYFSGSNSNSAVGGSGCVQKGRPRKRKIQPPADGSPTSEMNLSMRISSSSLGKSLLKNVIMQVLASLFNQKMSGSTPPLPLKVSWLVRDVVFLFIYFRHHQSLQMKTW